MLADGVRNEKAFLSTTMVDFDLRIKWARFCQPLAGLPINSRKLSSLSMQSNLSPPIKSIQQPEPVLISSLHGLFLLVPRWTSLANMSRILNVSPRTRMHSLSTNWMRCPLFRLGGNACQPVSRQLSCTWLVQLLRFAPHLMFFEIFLEEPPFKTSCLPCGLNFGYCYGRSLLDPLWRHVVQHCHGASSHGFAPSIFSSSTSLVKKELWHPHFHWRDQWV